MRRPAPGVTSIAKSIFVAILLTTLCGHPARAVILPPNEVVDTSLWDPNLWKSALFLRGPTSACSAHIVGNRVLLTAGVCIADGMLVAIVRDQKIAMACQRHPGFSIEDPRFDFALCLTQQSIIGADIERVSVNPAVLKPNALVYVGGFGCRLVGGVDRSLGDWTVGPARLEGPERAVSNAGVSWVLTGSMLCAGDSGGGTFVDPQLGAGSRLHIGVNSRTDYKSRSMIAVTSSPEFLAWAKAWSASNAVTICGLHAEFACQHESDGQVAPFTQIKGALEILIEQAQRKSVNPDAIALSRQIRVVARKDETLRQVASRACPDEQSDYFRQFEKTASLDTVLAAGEEVSIPACSLRSLDRVVRDHTVKVGDTVWKYFEDAIKNSQTPAWKDYKAPLVASGTPAEKDYFLNAFRRLNPTANPDALTIGNMIRIPIVPEGKEVETPVNATGRSRSISPIFTLQALVKGGCKQLLPPLGYPYDIAAVLDVLASNQRLNKHQRARVNVLIADSGLYGAGRGVFPFDNVLISPNWDNYSDNVAPLTGGSEQMHGTQVASLALGGPLFARFMAASSQSRIGLVIKRIYKKYAQGNEEWYDLIDHGFDEIMRSLSANDVRVVNLSITTPAPIDAFGPYLRIEEPTLFVVAAGNNSAQLGPDADARLYPALYGGIGNSGRWNLLTVAALDKDDSIAPYSNFSADYVEIAAPGCDVPAIEYNPDEHTWSGNTLTGTSMAAPLVSFAAALIRSEKGTGWNGVNAKRRLLVSADLDSGLLTKVHDGRKLNIVKAVALFSDLVEVRGKLFLGRATLIWNGTRLAEDFQIPLKCGGVDYRVKVSDILKIVPQFTNANKQVVTKIYYRGPVDTLMINRECASIPGVSVELKDDERAVTDQFDLNDIVDFVRRD